MIKQDFNRDWLFRNGLDNPMTSAFVGATAGTAPVQLPHDAMLSSARREENIDESGIGYFTPENVEYEKVLTFAQEDMGKAVYMECEGVYSNAVVEVNGYVATRHRFGFTGFVVNITDCLQPGANRIKISALNGVHPNGRYYTGTGIYRDVKLMMGDSLHIAPDGVRLTTLEADTEMAVIEVSADIRHCGIGHRKASFALSIFDNTGVEAAHAQTTFNVMSHDQVPLRLKLFVPNPKKWDTDAPYLYRYEAHITEDDRTVDTASGSFGIRTLQLDPLRGFRINGKSVKLKGGCIHGDNGCIGAISVPDAERRRVRMLKGAGYNALRTSHNPVSHAFLDACDEFGMLVLEEYADAWTHSKPAFDYSLWMEDCWERDIEDMVRVAYNHPSVIMYSIGNEIIDVGHELSARWGRRFAQKLRAIDPTRYVTNGINIMMANLD
jgi:Beta-galactosidase/beta-glucuronidase